MKGIEFEVPGSLIAQGPASPRNHAKLLVYNRKDKTTTHDIFANLATYLDPRTTVVTNNTKVDSCRYIFGKKEVFVLEKHGTKQVLAMVKPGRSFKVGATVELADGIAATVLAINEFGHRSLEFNVSHDAEILSRYEHVPLPPYIQQDDSLASEYQTVYAKHNGSKAAPTAGLHFTEDQLRQTKQNYGYAEVNLTVGLGTFAPITEDNFKTGTLHTESYSIDTFNTDIVQNAKHITAVGTTSMRTLESIDLGSDVLSYKGNTNIFITPGYEFKNVQSLVTNFHLPGTSLLLLVEAFIGNRTEMQRVYDQAIKNSYRFYSFGDAMLIV